MATAPLPSSRPPIPARDASSPPSRPHARPAPQVHPLFPIQRLPAPHSGHPLSGKLQALMFTGCSAFPQQGVPLPLPERGIPAASLPRVCSSRFTAQPCTVQPRFPPRWPSSATSPNWVPGMGEGGVDSCLEGPSYHPASQLEARDSPCHLAEQTPGRESCWGQVEVRVLVHANCVCVCAPSCPPISRARVSVR